jgi:hypothetical protein
MRNGSGDDWFLLFGPFGAGIKGLAHETPLADDKALLPEVRRQLPCAFSPFLNEPAFGWDWMSHFYWRGAEDPAWHRVNHPDPELAQAEDGSEDFLALLVQPASAYVEFAHWYYELDLALSAVKAIYRNTPLTGELVRTLNSNLTLEHVREDATEIAYQWPRATPNRVAGGCVRSPCERHFLLGVLLVRKAPSNRRLQGNEGRSGGYKGTAGKSNRRAALAVGTQPPASRAWTQ